MADVKRACLYHYWINTFIHYIPTSRIHMILVWYFHAFQPGLSGKLITIITFLNCKHTALINLPQPITFSQFIQPAKLANNCDIPHLRSEIVITAGMGRINKSESLPIPERRLRHVFLKTILSEDCSNNLNYKLDPDTAICASVIENGERVAIGDSGIFHN